MRFIIEINTSVRDISIRLHNLKAHGHSSALVMPAFIHNISLENTHAGGVIRISINNKRIIIYYVIN